MWKVRLRHLFMFHNVEEYLLLQDDSRAEPVVQHGFTRTSANLPS